MVFRCLKIFSILFFLFMLILFYAPGILPNLQFTAYEIEKTLPLTGPFSHNNALDDVEHMYVGHLHGPESIASRKPGEIFVGLHGGELVKISGKDFNSLEVVYEGNPCNFWEESKCGRPLGLRFAPNGKLIVTDTYYGIFEVNVDTGEKKNLIDPSKLIDGSNPLCPNDVDVDKSGNIYWTTSSTRATLEQGFLEFISSGSGRLLKYDYKTKTNKVLIDDIHFANGVQLSPDESFVLVAESCRFRVLRYWLKGPKAGTKDVFISGLPGIPDNIRSRKEGGYYLSLFSSNSMMIEQTRMLSKLPIVRKLFAKFVGLIKKSIDNLNLLFKSDSLSWMSYKMFHLSSYSLKDSHSIIAVILGEDGTVHSTLQGSSDKISTISEVQHVGDYLYFGSPFNHYLARIRYDAIPFDQLNKDSKAHPPKDEL